MFPNPYNATLKTLVSSYRYAKSATVSINLQLHNVEKTFYVKENLQPISRFPQKVFKIRLLHRHQNETCIMGKG